MCDGRDPLGTAGQEGCTLLNNQGNVQTTVDGPVASGTLPPGTVSVPASAFGQTLASVFTSAAAFKVRASAGAVVASGSVSPTAGAQIAIAFPSPPAPSGEVESVSLSAGTAAAGDTFTLTPGGAGSNGNIAALAGLATGNLVSGQTLGNAYAALVTTVGNNGQDARIAATAAQGVLTRAQQAQQSVSGVNLDEEAAHLVAYHQAYQAAAQVIATAQTPVSEPADHRPVGVREEDMRISTQEFLLGSPPDLSAQQSNINQLNQEIATSQRL